MDRDLEQGPLTFADLQEQQGEWSRRNFGDGPSHRALLGAFEELGELAHAHLKGEQGIRHTPDEIFAMKVDAVADTIIYLADYCNREGISMQGAVEMTWAIVRSRDWVANPEGPE